MTAPMMICDVLIVGGGPAGLAVAEGLPDDVTTLIVHQDREIGRPVRTSGGSWLSDMQRLGIPPHLYRIINRLTVRADTAETTLEMSDALPVVLDVTGLYQWLAGRSDHKARELLCASKFLHTEQQPDGRYLSTLRRRDGGPERVMSRYIIDASGTELAVLRSLSLTERPTRQGVGIEYEYPLGSHTPDHATLFVGQRALSGYGWIFPTPQDHLRVGVGIIHPDTDKSPRDLMDHVISQQGQGALGLTLTDDPVRVNAGTLPSVAYDPRLIYGRVIRVGDAANFATPTVGEGIRICVELGRLLGQQLGLALRNGSDRPLIHYERTCRRQLARHYRIGLAANRRIASYGPAQWDRSVARLARLNEDQVVALLRSEFTPAMMLGSALRSLRAKLRH